ncbi:MAG TPA: cobyric acid synthase, partial [Steroidobacteraceae bacterium]|nr:cobyric acid synthase [Steroidobacteraceae bacterium]
RVAAGGEMGSAQYLQAIAARVVPEVRMNPVLLKPERDTQSQVVLLGQRRDDLTHMEWRARAAHLWPTVKGCLDELLASHDVVVIEGAGSPAEINLQSTDIVNMRVAEACAAATLIVCDIDRGGAFAHLYGTVELLPAGQRALVRGFVLNKFRGDERLLAPGPRMLEQLTGIPTVAVLPLWRDHGLPEEDGVYDARPSGTGLSGTGLSVAVLAYPYISNLDEFTPLRRVPGLSLSWTREAQTVASADVLVLPGSKHVAADLEWLRRCGLDGAIAGRVAAGKPTLAICGGLQLLGERLDDPHGVEGRAEGLGLMPYRTEFLPAKTYRHGRYSLGRLQGFWQPLSGVEFEGYEIHHGITSTGPPAAAGMQEALEAGGGWQRAGLLALYPHGLFENARVLKALFGAEAPTLDDVMEGLADLVEERFERRTLLSYVQA